MIGNRSVPVNFQLLPLSCQPTMHLMIGILDADGNWSPHDRLLIVRQQPQVGEYIVLDEDWYQVQGVVHYCSDLIIDDSGKDPCGVSAKTARDMLATYGEHDESLTRAKTTLAVEDWILLRPCESPGTQKL